jgi:DNA-binding XRE family transcriptional regulator
MNEVFSWVGRPSSDRPAAKGAGRYSRPLSGRDKIIAAAFGDEVRRLRKKAGMSTQQLADLVGVSQPSIVYIEKHRANVELRLIWDFAEALGVEAAQFVSVCDRAITLAMIAATDPAAAYAQK